MKKVLIAYFSSSGRTQRMADYVAEGVRIGGQQAAVKKIADIKDPAVVKGFDGLIVGSPTFSQNAPNPVKKFLDAVIRAGAAGKMAGAFGSYSHDVGYTHEDYAPAQILDYLDKQGKMTPFDLGAFHLQEDAVDTDDGMKACHDYGRVFGEKLGA
jgi:flavodoxin